jgi:replicative DNA helicase
MMVLGCMLTSINSLNIAAERLEEADFYFSEHKIIFRCLQDAYKADRPADIHLVAEELKRQEKLQAVGGVVYLTSVAQYAGTSAYIEEYTEVVKNKSVLRQMVSSAQQVEKQALGEPADVNAALDEAQQLFFRIGQARNPQAGILVSDVLSGKSSVTTLPFIKELEARQEQFMRLGAAEQGITGIPTYFTDLDRMINGLGNSHLIILASRPAMGKTALALNIAENISFKNDIPVGIFSLEMTAEQLVHRIVCSQAEVESMKIRTGSLSSGEFHQVVEAVNEIQHHTIIIDDQPGLKITDLRARARRMKESYNVGLIIIDYLQLISGSGALKTIENRQNEISEISRMLKILAREVDVPIVCLSQLSRKVEERTGHRPVMSDLRESGCLAGETVIVDAATGEKFTIQALAERPTQTPITVHAANVDLSLGLHQMTRVFYSGKKLVYELKTRDGRAIRASGNHPFFAEAGWTPLDQLTAGDAIGVPSQDRTELIWDEIYSVTPLMVVDVYDATVEGAHNFIADDIIVHNSIEQDADVVVFLVRREYYDPYDRPGQAELIVAKNRHGGIGNITLTYRKEIAQFANFSQRQYDGEMPDGMSMDVDGAGYAANQPSSHMMPG